MFDSSHPPLLALPVTMRQAYLFPTHEGYEVHFLSDDQALVSYKDGWTFPLSIQQQKYVSASPMFLIANKGGITTAGSTFNKGYAHQFCQENGQDLEHGFIQKIFPDQPDTDWILVQNAVTMIWLQYGNKNQYCGDSGFEMERIYYGKLLIREFVIREDFAPILGKHAATPALIAKQYRVESNQLYYENWTVKDREPREYLQELLTSHNLDRYQSAVMLALAKATS